MMNEEITIHGVDFKIEKPIYIGGKIPKGREYDWCICQWDSDHKYNWVIAILEWNSKEPCYELRSIGMRLAESGSKKLLKWILKFSEEAENDNFEEVYKNDL